MQRWAMVSQFAANQVQYLVVHVWRSLIKNKLCPLLPQKSAPHLLTILLLYVTAGHSGAPAEY